MERRRKAHRRASASDRYMTEAELAEYDLHNRRLREV